MSICLALKGGNSFFFFKRKVAKVKIDSAYVDARLGELSQDDDLSRYIL